jgi:trimeric autotransporter adhesin
MKRRWITTLAATFAAFAASAGTAIAGTPVPVQSATQSSTTDQAALAASSATQVDPTNQNISVRVLSPGNDGAVSQSNEAESSATAANTGTTTQNATQAQSPGCSCAATAGLTSGKLDDVLAGAMQAAGTDAAAPATAAPAPSTGSSTQSNEASSTGTAANTAPTTQAATQSGTGTGGVQSSQQDATTDQTAQAASSATQIAPSNSNISVRVLSPGNDGAVSQSNEASSTADATNSAPTTQSSSQSGTGSGVQSSTQNADTSQKSVALSSATQVHPENSNVSVRILSPGNGGSVSQSNEAESSANAQNTAPVTQTARQTELGPQCGCVCGCSSTSPAVQAIGQSSSVWQDAAAASSATQLGASNVSDPVRIASGGNDGALTQENEAESSASAKNTAPVTQWGSQQQAASPCGCTTGAAVQALGQSSWIGQQAGALSSAWQIGASNESGPVRIASYGNGGPVSQSNEAESSASASNTALPYQVGSQMQGGSGVQALGQHSSIWQGALAASAAFQLPGRSTCGCGSSFGNSAGPIRVGSPGNDGALTQENEVSSSADASNWAAPTQIGTQTQFLPPCGCSGLRVQALGQESLIHQIAVALSSATQIGASNTSDPVRIWSPNDSGNTRRLKEE